MELKDDRDELELLLETELRLELDKLLTELFELTELLEELELLELLD